MLFSEDFSTTNSLFIDNSNQNVNINESNQELNSSSIKTFGDLRKSILEFGVGDYSTSINYKTSNEESVRLERQNTLESLSFYKEAKTINDDPMFEKIRPGLSAKRYLSNWTKSWKPQLYESLTKDGRIKEESLYETNEILPNVKHRIDDDLSKIPPAYRLQRQWLSLNVAPLKGYRFFRDNSGLLGLSMIF